MYIMQTEGIVKLYYVLIRNRSKWPRSLRHRSAVACLLRLWVRIPQRARMFFSNKCCVLLGRGICDELITRPKEFYWLRWVVVCDLVNLKDDEALARVGTQRHRKKRH
jgi:hypothetical protein